jgi:hypothetical protein
MSLQAQVPDSCGFCRGSVSGRSESVVAMRRGASLRAALQTIASSLAAVHDEHEVLIRLTHGAIETMPSFDHATTTCHWREGQVATIAATDPWVERCDELQAQLDEGPSLDVNPDDAIVASSDVANDSRWPQYGSEVADLGVVSQLSICLGSDRHQRTALNLYSCGPVAIDDPTIEVAELFGESASGVVQRMRAVENLEAALESRTTIGQAIGIVMDREGVDERTAFATLVQRSQHTNAKLRDLAADIVTEANVRSLGKSGRP